MSPPDPIRDARRQVLRETLRGLRRTRGLSSSQVAERMGIELRAYQRFEAAKGYTDLERILSFAVAIECDPMAIFAALTLLNAELGWLFADNKMQLISAHALERFARRMGEGLRHFDAAAVITAFDWALDELARQKEEREASARRWLDREVP